MTNQLYWLCFLIDLLSNAKLNYWSDNKVSLFLIFYQKKMNWAEIVKNDIFMKFIFAFYESKLNNDPKIKKKLTRLQSAGL